MTRGKPPSTVQTRSKADGSAVIRFFTISWYRLLDSLQSRWRKARKEISSRKKWGWGSEWRDMVRPGRTYTRVENQPSTVTKTGNITTITIGSLCIRPEPGWEWTCPNCKEYSIITESMMPDILAAWAVEAKRMSDLAASKGVKYTIGPKPTAATAGCTNCKYRPGAPE